ncbi:MAG: WG repeat-containing protein [Tissierellia bacterium]|nr:WG repeat-containing protein [Tissierellia bacterium]
MLKTCRTKFILFAMQIFVFLCFTGNFAYAVEFNDDIQKVTFDYYYYEGFGEDKVVKSVKDGSWSILKSDGEFINLNGKYLTYIDMEGKNLGLDSDYYRFLMAIDSHGINSTRFIHVDKNGLEPFVDGYDYVFPSKNENYFIVCNENDNGDERGLYHKYNKILIIPTIYSSLKYINDDRIIASKNNNYGLIDINQNEIIPFEYNYMDYISDNFIVASNEDGKYGVINIDNEILLSFEYDEISNVYESDDYFRISKNNKFGLVNVNDIKIVIPFEYDNIEYSGNELVIARNNNKSGLINMNNKVVIPFTYDYISYNKEGFIVFKKELPDILNTEGEYYNILEMKDDFVSAIIYGNDEYKYVIYNINGEEIATYDHIDYYSADEYMIVNDNLIYKETGEKLFINDDPYYTNIKSLNDKYYVEGNRNNYALFNSKGQELTKIRYEDISIINVNGEEILAAKYTVDSFNVKFDYFKQTKGPSTWAIEEVTKAIENNLVPFEYQSAFTFNIKRYEFCSIIVEFLEEYYDTTREEIIRDNNVDLINTPIIDGFSDDIAICLNLGIVKGRGNGIFDSDSDITREEAAVMITNLAKYLGINTNTEEVYLNDKSEVSEWAVDSVNYVLQSKFMQGTGNNMFSPKSNITREQTYIIMNRIQYLGCGAISCGTCAIGDYDQELSDKLLQVDDIDEFVIYVAPVGII